MGEELRCEGVVEGRDGRWRSGSSGGESVDALDGCRYMVGEDGFEGLDILSLLGVDVVEEVPAGDGSVEIRREEGDDVLS